MIYGDEWIGGVTKREKWLIARYVDGSIDPSGSSFRIGMGYVIAGRSWAEYPSDPKLVAEVEQARDRNDWSKEQWRQAIRWLETHGFDLPAESVDADALARKIGVSFRRNSAASVVVVPAPKPKLRGRNLELRNRIIEKMKVDLAKGYDLQGALQKELAAKYGASRDTCEKARSCVLSENVAK